MTEEKQPMFDVEKKVAEANCTNLFDQYFDSWKYHIVRKQSKEELLVTVKFLAHMLSYDMFVRRMDWKQFEDFYYDWLHNKKE